MKKIKSIRGFTLIEIMVAMAIGALLLSGIVQVFVSLKRTDRVAMSLSRVQEAGRTALDTLGYDLRMAGYRGCSDPTLVENATILAQTPPTTNFVDTSLRGVDVTATGWSSPTALADLSDIDGSDAGDARLDSDVVSIMRASENSVPLTTHNNGASTVLVATNTLGLNDEDLAILSDCESMDMFRISSVTAATGTVTYGHDSGSNTQAQLSKAYGAANTQLMGFIANTYFVADTGRRNTNGDIIYALYRRDQNGTVEEIVEGVENLQITYGEEFTNGNRRFVPASTATLDMNAATSIKLSLLVSSNDRVLESSDTFVYPMAGVQVEPASSGGAVTYADDRRLRKVFSMTINLRNRRVSI